MSRTISLDGHTTALSGHTEIASLEEAPILPWAWANRRTGELVAMNYVSREDAMCRPLDEDKFRLVKIEEVRDE